MFRKVLAAAVLVVGRAAIAVFTVLDNRSMEDPNQSEHGR